MFCTPTRTRACTRRIGPLVITRGEGIYVFDDEGNRYIEGIERALLRLAWLQRGTARRGGDPADAQAALLPFVRRTRSNEPSIELAERLIALAPVPMSKVFFANSGSEANDTAVKLVWYYHNAIGKPQKKKIISRIRGLSRRDRRVGEPDRPAQQPPRLRSADRPHPPHRLPGLTTASASRARARRSSRRAAPNRSRS